MFVCPCLVPRGRAPLSVSYSLLGAPPTPTSLTKSSSFVCHTCARTHTTLLLFFSVSWMCPFLHARFVPVLSSAFGPRATSAQPPCHLVPPSLYAHHTQDGGETSGRSWCYKTLPLRQGLFLPAPCLVFLALMRTLPSLSGAEDWRSPRLPLV